MAAIFMGPRHTMGASRSVMANARLITLRFFLISTGKNVTPIISLQDACSQPSIFATFVYAGRYRGSRPYSRCQQAHWQIDGDSRLAHPTFSTHCQDFLPILSIWVRIACLHDTLCKNLLHQTSDSTLLGICTSSEKIRQRSERDKGEDANHGQCIREGRCFLPSGAKDWQEAQEKYLCICF